MKKKINRGKPLEELVKGSLDYTMQMIRDAFRAQFPSSGDAEEFYIHEIFADHVIVSDWGNKRELKADEYWMVTFTKGEDGEYVFAARDEWEVVELAYQAQTGDQSPVISDRLSVISDQSSVIMEGASPPAPLQMSEERRNLERGGKRKGNRKRFEEMVINAVRLEEGAGGANMDGPWRVKGVGVTADVVNGNSRRYPAAVLERAVAELKNHLHESNGQGRMLSLTGEADHPADKGNRRPLLSEIVFNWDSVAFDGRQVLLEGNLLGTSAGKDIHAQMLGGVMPGISQRGYGESRQVKENGVTVEEITQLVITGYDGTAPNEQSDPNGSIEYFETQGDDEMNLEELLKALREHPELFEGVTEAQVKKMGETQLKALEEKMREALGIDEKANIAESLKATAEKARKFEEGQKQAGIDAAIAEATKELPFGEKLNALFVEAIRAGEYGSPEAVKKFAEAKRREYSQLAAAGVLKGMGFDEKKQTFQVIGDVLETETGTPEFARAAFELSEAMARIEMRARRDLRKAETRSELLARLVIERFDKLYRQHLVQEARMYQEAEQTSDLDLPYSVSRAIIEEAFPSLVAANIFDVGVIETSPTRLYFEAHSAESGYTATATAEVVTGGAEEVWYDLDYGRVTPGTVTVTSNPAGTTYTENTDFVIDYAGGRIKFLTAGSIGANDVLVTYTYTAIRQGEMAPIERAKLTLSYITVEAAADRLADQISREAVVFSRSQLGYDAVGRTMANLIRQTQRKIDQGLLYMALAAVKSVASNTGGTWTTGNDQSDYDDLVRLIGETKLKVAKRPYTPSYILCSLDTAEDLSNWDGFKRDGFPNAIMNAAGYAGNVKGLAIFASSEFPTTDLIVGNRELVMYRVFQPMIIKGPFPTYDVSGGTSKLVAADQYYTEEFNVTRSPVEEKGAYLTIAAGS